MSHKWFQRCLKDLSKESLRQTIRDMPFLTHQNVCKRSTCWWTSRRLILTGPPSQMEDIIMYWHLPFRDRTLGGTSDIRRFSWSLRHKLVVFDEEKGHAELVASYDDSICEAQLPVDTTSPCTPRHLGFYQHLAFEAWTMDINGPCQERKKNAWHMEVQDLPLPSALARATVAGVCPLCCVFKVGSTQCLLKLERVRPWLIVWHCVIFFVIETGNFVSVFSKQLLDPSCRGSHGESHHRSGSPAAGFGVANMLMMKMKIRNRHLVFGALVQSSFFHIIVEQGAVLKDKLTNIASDLISKVWLTCVFTSKCMMQEIIKVSKCVKCVTLTCNGFLRHIGDTAAEEVDHTVQNLGKTKPSEDAPITFKALAGLDLSQNLASFGRAVSTSFMAW